MQTRRHGSGAKRILVDVHHFGLDGSPVRAVNEAGGHLAGRPRVDREDGGVHLHTGGNPEDGHAAADGGEDVYRRAVASREEEQVDAPRDELGGDPPGVFTGRCLTDRPGDRRGQAAVTGLALAHLPRCGHELELPAGEADRPQRILRPGR